MSTVLLQADALQTEPVNDASTIQVPVTVNVVNGKVSFKDAKTADYVISSEGITLVGSGGMPREFRLVFTLSPEAEGYTFANPALKFFQGGSKKAGFRIAPDAAGTSATLSLFNLLAAEDQPVQDDFSVLLVKPTKKVISHDPTILWEPPKGMSSPD